MSESLVQIFRHNAWANRRLFEACEGLSDEQLDATLAGTFGSIRDTLMHITGAQERFAAALAGKDTTGLFSERDPFPGVARLREIVGASSDALVDLATQPWPDGATITTTHRGEENTLPVWLMFLQAINHATEHRSQIATILTQQGIDPPGMDGWTYDETQFDADWSRLWSG